MGLFYLISAIVALVLLNAEKDWAIDKF